MKIDIETLRNTKGVGSKTLERIIKQHEIDNDIKSFESIYIPSEDYKVDNDINLWQGDCLKLMSHIPDKSVDMILADLPYGTTECKWDTIIPFDPLWEQYNRIIKDNGAIVLTATNPFSSMLVASNAKGFKHEWIWDKVRPSGFQVAKYKPMQRHESILVFTSKGERVNYFPIMELRDKPVKGRVASSSESSPLKYNDGKTRIYTHKNPQSIIVSPKPSRAIHPTQKPVALLEYLIKTYTNEGDTVLDNVMGSGSTGVACVNTKRNFIGIELDENYFNTAKKRIEEVGE